MSTKRGRKSKKQKEALKAIRMDGLQYARPSEKARWQFDHRPYTNRRQG